MGRLPQRLKNRNAKAQGRKGAKKSDLLIFASLRLCAFAFKKDLKADADAERELDVVDARVGARQATKDVADDTEPEVVDA